MEATWQPRPGYFDSSPPIKLVIVGAGISGIAAAILISRKVRNLSYTIYERQERVGGTWAQNRYPGVRCDIPSHSYQLSFAPNTHWSEYYSSGAEIREYYQKLVRDFEVEDHVRLEHEVLSAEWSEELHQWNVAIKNLKSNEIVTETAHFFVEAAGRISSARYPNIPELSTKFGGTIVHTSEWTDTLTSKIQGKRIAIIGNGASGQQLLTNIVDKVARIDHYARSRQWIVPSFHPNFIAATPETPGGYVYTDQDKEEFERNPETYLTYRQSIEKNLHGRVEASISNSVVNEKIRQGFEKALRSRTNDEKSWFDRLVPDYAPLCKRPIPSPGYVEAIRGPKVEYIDQSRVEYATENGLVTEDGRVRDVDIIVVATGFKAGFTPCFPTIGKGGLNLQQQWAADGPIGYPKTYFGMMAPNFPNYFAVVQANSNGMGGSYPLNAEISATYIAKVIRKVQSQGYLAIWPSQQATDDFDEIISAHFADKVINDDCDGWWKAGFGKSRPLLYWPGSGHHRFDIIRDPRWEDFIFEKSETGKRNRFEYFANGIAEYERTADVKQMTRYLKEAGKIDLSVLHENWND